jgi:hypothetical protein
MMADGFGGVSSRSEIGPSLALIGLEPVATCQEGDDDGTQH